MSFAQTPETVKKDHVYGGPSDFHPPDEEELAIWNTYKEHIEKQIQAKYGVPQTYLLEPSQVAVQIVAGRNYFFKVLLPDQTYATVRVFHVPWREETHGKVDQVTVQ